MKRYPNLTILTSLILVMLSAITLLTLVSFKSIGERFKVPTIIYDRSETVGLVTEFMKNVNYEVERVQEFSDTLDLLKEHELINYYEYYDISKPEPSYMSNAELKLIVDTLHPIPLKKDESVSAFPVYIINRSTNKSLNLEVMETNLNMVMEAISSKNTWEPIEYCSVSKKGLDHMSVNVPPHHYLFTRSIVYDGAQKIKCRLRLQNKKEVFYSNEFYTGVNYSQFVK